MFQIITRVKLKPGTADHCARLFEETNPALVSDQRDWLGAKMLFARESETVTVIAFWRKVESYKALSSSQAFQSTMGKFGQYFAGPPEITVNEVLVEMTPDSIKAS